MGIIITFGGQKGGVGKTTEATNTGLMLAMEGKNVLLADLDDQLTAMRWNSRRAQANKSPFLASVHLLGSQVFKDLDEHAKNYDYIIVDTGGKDSSEVRAALVAKSTEMFISPLRPSEYDFDTLDKVNELVDEASYYNEKLVDNCFILLSQCPTHHKSTVYEEAKEFILANYPKLKVLDEKVSHRQAYIVATSNYCSVVQHEYEKMASMPSYRRKSYQPKASMEMIKLYERIIGSKFTALDFSKFESCEEVANV